MFLGLNYRSCKLSLICLICLLLASCRPFQLYRPDNRQGNFVEQKMVDQLHPGLSTSEVTGILGTPALRPNLSDNRLDYLYRFKAGKDCRVESHTLNLFFHNDQLQCYQGSWNLANLPRC